MQVAGVAWLSTTRAVRRSIQLLNEWNPRGVDVGVVMLYDCGFQLSSMIDCHGFRHMNLVSFRPTAV